MGAAIPLSSVGAVAPVSRRSMWTMGEGMERGWEEVARRDKARVGCVLRCVHYGSAKCLVCPIPGPRGEALCPECRRPLYYVDSGGTEATWGCNSLTACGKTVKVPLGNIAAELADRSAVKEDRRWLATKGRRERRQKAKAQGAAVIAG